MAKQTFPYDFTELTKMLQDYQVPGVDWQELMASQQKNVEALRKANQVLFEGAQAVIQREVEIMQKAMQEFAETSRDLIARVDDGHSKHIAHQNILLPIHLLRQSGNCVAVMLVKFHVLWRSDWAATINASKKCSLF